MHKVAPYHVSLNLPPLARGFYSEVDAAIDEETPAGSLRSSPARADRPSPQAGSPDQVLLKRAKQRGLLLASSHTPVYHYSSGGGVDELYRIHCGVHHYRGLIIIVAAWQPIVSNEHYGPVYIAAWDEGVDWREGLDAWLAVHGTANALNDLLADLDKSAAT